ncbi:MAG: MBOAT family O-acyltransferase, partial [Rhodospirillales bacterium]|nr:MBOAT family O-acyltransferase [Rhodospirillales bacterium]
FWRRWHITLSSFLRNYVYIALGGNRRGASRRYLNLLITMALGGLWHGANLTFVFWGLIHGLLLAINHGIRYFCPWRTPVWIGIPVTFLCIVLAWVAFRAENFDSMLNFYAVMFGSRGIVVPWSYYPLLEFFGPVTDLLCVRVGNIVHFGGIQQIIATILAMIVVFFAPSSMSLLNETDKQKFVRSKYMPLGLGVLGTVAMLVMWAQSNVTFLYFQF